jgi:glycosyltransferase involved in cell wall biosynthesis
MVVKRLLKFARPAAAKSLSASNESVVRGAFDSVFYRRRYPDLAAIVELFTHYLQFGWREGRDPVEWFSVKAYLAAYPDVAAANIDPFGHYLTHGKAEGRITAPAYGTELWAIREFHSATGVYLAEFPEDFRVEPYAMATNLYAANRWEVLAHFINHGALVPRLRAIAKPGPDLLVIIGDAFQHRDRAKALSCYQLAELAGMRDADLMHKLGDCYLNFGQLINARAAYISAIDLGGKQYWTYRHLGGISSSLGQFDEAAKFFAEAHRLRPEKYVVRYEGRQAAADWFDVQWANANGLALAGNDEAAATAMADAIDEYQDYFVSDTQTLPLTGNSLAREPHVAIFGSDSLPQCKLYRITQKIDQFHAVGQKVDFFPLSKASELSRNILYYDVVIIYRAPAIPDVLDILARARDYGVVTFYDIDDLIFDDSCYPPTRQALGDMVTPAEYAGLVTGRALFREAMAMCDYGIASTPPLQRAMTEIVRRKRCFLSRNALSSAHLNLPEVATYRGRSAKGRFVLFYGSGSRSHNANFALIAKPLARALRRHPHVELRIIGPLEVGDAFAGLARRVFQIPFTKNLPAYWRELAVADVNLAPLTSGVFNDGKSEIKWMEAAMLGIPSVVSSSAVYDEVVQHGNDGFLARSEEDWDAILDQLITNPEVGFAVGAKARDRVFSEYALHEGGENLLAILREVMAEYSPVALADNSPRKPRVLVVNIFYPPEFIGGATRVVEQTVTDILDLAGDLFSVEVFCGREADGNPGMIERYAWNGVPVTSLSPFPDVDRIERSIDTASAFDAYLDLVRPAIIHFHCIQRLSASLLDVAIAKDIPYVVSAHDGWWVSDRQFLINDAGVPVYETDEWGDSRRLERLKEGLNKGRATIAVSDAQARLYRQRGVSNVITIANGSETLAGVSPAPADGPVWLGLLGGLGLAKGSALLEQVLLRRTYANLRFIVVDHSMPEGSVRYDLWGGNRIKLVGKTSFANVANVYSQIHVLLAISVCVESFGLVAREARRLGRWVIASDRGGMAEDVIVGENGFVIDPSQIDDLLKIIDAIDAEPDHYRIPPPYAGELRGRKDVAADLVTLYRSILHNDDSAL